MGTCEYTYNTRTHTHTHTHTQKKIQQNALTCEGAGIDRPTCLSPSVLTV